MTLSAIDFVSILNINVAPGRVESELREDEIIRRGSHCYALLRQVWWHCKTQFERCFTRVYDAYLERLRQVSFRQPIVIGS